MSLGVSIFSSTGSDNQTADYNTDLQNNTNLQKTLLTVKGDSAKIEGKLIVSKSIEIDCEIHGELEVDGQIIILQSGYVNADVKTIDATINGVYEGNMEATGNVQITQTGKVNGNIKTDSLIIEKGGVFSGNVTRISNVNFEKKNDIEEEEVAKKLQTTQDTKYDFEKTDEELTKEYSDNEETKDEDTLEL
jgi:cytoskeletal protein CcmA (bactofilin family)